MQNIYFIENLILSTIYEFYKNDITATSFINIKHGDVSTKIVL